MDNFRQFSVGDRVEFRTQWPWARYCGTVSAVVDERTVLVRFDDGVVSEIGTWNERLRLLEVKEP